MTDDDLQPLGPAEAVDLYLEHRQPELTEKSLQNHKYRLDTFVEFCAEHDIDSLHELDGRDLHRYYAWRRRDGIATLTLRTNLATLRVALEFWASIDAVPPGMRERVKLPEVPDEENSRDVKLESQRAQAIIDHLDRFQYASLDHVVIAVLWNTGIRLGSLRALDVEDWFPDDQALRLRHRPETGTPLKNRQAAQRMIHVGNYYAQVLEDYLDFNRPDVTDEHGRRPLIASDYGRLSSTPIRKICYAWTRPCEVSGECPHDRDLDTCEALQNRETATKCPSSVSPHPIRRGSITHHLRSGTPEQIVSDRMDVSGDVLDEHYDRRTEREKMQIRKDHLPDS